MCPTLTSNLRALELPLAPEGLTTSVIDSLGERLRAPSIASEDLRLLDKYRRSFQSPYEHVISNVRSQLSLQPTGRPAKSTTAIREKLRRESIRLRQMQDIAGCRIIVSDVTEQGRVVSGLKSLFPQHAIFDRREKPSHGYRAVHFVVRNSGLPIEVQVRTRLQHLWAELSEKAADVIDASIKYGGGPEVVRKLLTACSEQVRAIDRLVAARVHLEEVSLEFLERSPEEAAAQGISLEEIEKWRQRNQEHYESSERNLLESMKILTGMRAGTEG